MIAGVIALAVGSATVALAAGQAPVRLRHFVCQRAPDPAARGVSVTAVMRPVPGTGKLAMRFQLLKRTRRYGHAVSLLGGGLRTWITPNDPTLGSQPGDRWVLKHPVVDLAGPAYYQFRVEFRWSDTSGHQIERAARNSPVCFQPELRADLVVSSIQTYGLPADPGQDAFAATIRNTGKTAAGPFEVQLSDNGVVKNKTVTQLDSHRHVVVHFTGPACGASAPATITADPTSQIDDANRSNNAMQTSCS